MALLSTHITDHVCTKRCPQGNDKWSKVDDETVPGNCIVDQSAVQRSKQHLAQQTMPVTKDLWSP